MKNIYEILKGLGIEVPEDKKGDFDKELAENYKTINEMSQLKEKLTTAEQDRDTYKNKYDTDIAQRDSDLEALKTQLAEAGQSKDKLATLQTSLEEAQQKYNEDKAAWEKQLADQQYTYLVNDATRDLKFSSKAARKVFNDELIANPLQVKDGALLGFTDYVNVYKESNPDSFLADDDGAGTPPPFSGKSNPADGDKGKGSEAPKTVPVIW